MEKNISKLWFVPESSLVLFEDQRTVYVLVGDQVQQRKLKLGYVGDGWAEVLSGIAPWRNGSCCRSKYDARWF